MVFPTYVGVIPLTIKDGNLMKRVPHIRGGDSLKIEEKDIHKQLRRFFGGLFFLHFF